MVLYDFVQTNTEKWPTTNKYPKYIQWPIWFSRKYFQKIKVWLSCQQEQTPQTCHYLFSRHWAVARPPLSHFCQSPLSPTTKPIKNTKKKSYQSQKQLVKYQIPLLNISKNIKTVPKKLYLNKKIKQKIYEPKVWPKINNKKPTKIQQQQIIQNFEKSKTSNKTLKTTRKTRQILRKISNKKQI